MYTIELLGGKAGYKCDNNHSGETDYRKGNG